MALCFRYKMSYNLFLDDDPERIPHKLSWIQLPLVEWKIVRSYKQFVGQIIRKGLPLRVSFDHDLADEHYAEYLASTRDGKFNYNNVKEKTGYHCCKWLIEYCLQRDLPFPEYYIHTQNPIGKQNIKSLIDSYKKVCKNG